MQKFQLVTVLLYFFLAKTNSQTVTIASINITWTNLGSQTNFVMRKLLTDLSPVNSYIAFGFSSQGMMNEANVVVCKSRTTGSSIEHYYNSGFRSTVLVASNPTLGISNAQVQIQNNNLICSFTRDNSNTGSSNYFRITPTTSIFMIAAYGPIGKIAEKYSNFLILIFRIIILLRINRYNDPYCKRSF